MKIDLRKTTDPFFLEMGDLDRRALEEVVEGWNFKEGIERTIGEWIANFAAMDKPLAAKILKNFTYFDTASFEGQLKLRRENVRQILAESGETLADALFVMPDDPIDSSHRHAYDLAKVWQLNANQFVSVAEFDPAMAASARRVVLFNDTYGSGQQLIEMLRRQPEIKKASLIVVGVVMGEKALSRIAGEFSKVQIIPQEAFPSIARYFSSPEIDRLRALGRKVYAKHPLGFGESGLLVGYYYQCPNNTIPLIWADGSNNASDGKTAGFPWKPLFPYRPKPASHLPAGAANVASHGDRAAASRIGGSLGVVENQATATPLSEPAERDQRNSSIASDADRRGSPKESKGAREEMDGRRDRAAPTDRRAQVASFLEAIPSADDTAMTIAAISERLGCGDQREQFEMLLPILTTLNSVSVTDFPGGVSPAIKARSEPAFYLHKSLAAYIRESQPLLSNWERLGTLGDERVELPSMHNGPQFLRFMETGRVPRTPIREHTVVKAIISSENGRSGERSYLVRFNEITKMYHLIGGRQRRSDSNLEITLRRELHEELSLVRDSNIASVEIKALGNPVEHVGIAPSIGATTRYMLHYYAVHLRNISLGADPSLQWISGQELLGGSARDGVKVNEPAFAAFLDQFPGGLNAFGTSMVRLPKRSLLDRLLGDSWTPPVKWWSAACLMVAMVAVLGLLFIWP